MLKMGRSGGRSPHLALGVLLACCLLSCFEAAVSNVKSIQSLDFVIYSHAHSRQPIDIAEFIAKAKSTLSQARSSFHDTGGERARWDLLSKFLLGISEKNCLLISHKRETQRFPPSLRPREACRKT